MLDKKVDLIQIGFQKCGTTSLFKWLRQHPELEFYNNKKDPQYFNRNSNWRESIDEYHSNFNDKTKLWAEASDQYTIFPEYIDTYKRLFEYNPDLKFIAIIRDPVERILSHYDFNKVRGGARGNKEEVILGNSKYVNRSKYYLQLSLFLEFFKKDQFHLVLFDDLKEEPQKELKKVFEFLNVEDISEKIEYKNRKSTVNEGYMKFKFQKYYIKNTINAVRRRSPGFLRKLFKPFFYSSLNQKTNFDLNFKRVLWILVQDDVKMLEEKFDLDLASWRDRYRNSEI